MRELHLFAVHFLISDQPQSWQATIHLLCEHPSSSEPSRTRPKAKQAPFSSLPLVLERMLAGTKLDQMLDKIR